MSRPTPAELDRTKVLVVDDHPDNLRTIRECLASRDYQLVEVASGEEALPRILRDEFAVVLLDVAMPDLDGFQTAALIRQRYSERPLPIVFLAANAAEAQRVGACGLVGGADYLTKPFVPEILRAKVAVFVELFRQEQQLRRQERELRRWELLRSEDARRAEEALYQATFDYAPIGLAHLAPSGQILRVNQHFLLLLSSSDEEVFSLRLQDLARGDDLERMRECLHALVAGGQPTCTWEGRLLRRTGGSFVASATFSAVRAPNGATQHLILVLEDFTERQLSQRREHLLARASELLLGSPVPRAVLPEIAGEAVGAFAEWVAMEFQPSGSPPESEVVLAAADPQRQDLILRLSSRLQALSAGDPAGTLALTQARCIPDPLHPVEGEALALSELGLASAIVAPVEARGQLLAVLLFATEGVRRRPFAEPDLVVARDLAHRIALAMENARLVREAREALSTRDEFLSLASHELRTPLTPLQIVFQRFLGARATEAFSSLSPQQVRSLLDRSERQVRKLVTLVENLLDATRLERGTFTLHREELDLAEVTREVAGRFAEDLSRAESELHFAATEGTVGSWDRVRIEQVVANLLNNAIRFGAGRPIDLSVGGHSGEVRLVLRDRGRGIRPEELSRLFERGPTPGRSHPPGGLGLGLPLVRQIVEAHGGTIEVTSEPQQGTVFTVSLPAEAGDRGSPLPPLSPEAFHEPGADVQYRADSRR